MQKIRYSLVVMTSALGLACLTSSPASWAASDATAWNTGQAELEKQLPAGQEVKSYRQKLEKLGYQVTSINYDTPTYLEYEVVKGDQTWEVQIDVDADTRKATAIEIDPNMYRTEATTQALAGKAVTALATPAGTAERYSDRHRARASTLITELEALPVGHDKAFYKDALKKHGYEVTKVAEDTQDMLTLEAVKNKQSVQLNVSFDESTGKSTKLDADSMWVESESTYQERTSQR
jgi:hypothetical protein